MPLRHAPALVGGLLAALLAWPLQAAPVVELELLAEHPLDGMPAGNLSGLSLCGDALQAVSDRDDGQIYHLEADADGQLQVRGEPLLAPAPPTSALPWGVRMRNSASALLRGGRYDFEGIACDAQGNRYLVSESQAAVLMVPRMGTPSWLRLPSSLIRQARASGMLLNFNALFEGIAVDPAGERLWLAAERERRGLLVLHQRRGSWRCLGGCVLLAEGGVEEAPEALAAPASARDFSALALHGERLFVVERLAHRICRIHPATGARERCWSFAEQALQPQRRYATRFGMVEGLVLDAQGAWLAVDNGGKVRADGEARPLVWRFAAPPRGWLQP